MVAHMIQLEAIQGRGKELTKVLTERTLAAKLDPKNGEVDYLTGVVLQGPALGDAPTFYTHDSEGNPIGFVTPPPWPGIAHPVSGIRRAWFEVSVSRAEAWSHRDPRFAAIGYYPRLPASRVVTCRANAVASAGRSPS